MRYLAEFYLPAGRVKLDDLIRQARAAANHSGSSGPAVQLLYAVHVPTDESCFAVYEAASAGAVTAAGARAGIEFDRIVEAITAP